jgi:hypothetical protein
VYIDVAYSPVCLSVCLSVCLCVCLSLYQSFCLFVCMHLLSIHVCLAAQSIFGVTPNAVSVPLHVHHVCIYVDPTIEELKSMLDG